MDMEEGISDKSEWAKAEAGKGAVYSRILGQKP